MNQRTALLNNFPFHLPDSRSTHVITISSGKGGVGKTSIAVNIAVTLSRMGKRVCIFDADLGLANVNILMGFVPKYTLEDVISGAKDLNDITVTASSGIKIIPASSGVEKLADLNADEIKKIISSLITIRTNTDVMLVDTAAGISSMVLPFVLAANTPVVVVTPEPTSMTDGYAMIKVMSIKNYRQPVWLLINMVESLSHARRIFKKFKSVVNRFLPVDIKFLGYVPTDNKLKRSILMQTPLALYSKGAKASRCFWQIGKTLIKTPLRDGHEDISIFWENTIKEIKKPLFASSTVESDKYTNIKSIAPPVSASPHLKVKEEGVYRVKQVFLEEFKEGHISKEVVKELLSFISSMQSEGSGHADLQKRSKDASTDLSNISKRIEDLVSAKMRRIDALSDISSKIKRDTAYIKNLLDSLSIYSLNRNDASFMTGGRDLIKGYSRLDFKYGVNRASSSDNPNNTIKGKKDLVIELNLEDHGQKK